MTKKHDQFIFYSVFKFYVIIFNKKTLKSRKNGLF